MESRPKGIFDRCPNCGALTELRPVKSKPMGEHVFWECSMCEVMIPDYIFREWVRKRTERAVADANRGKTA